MAFRPGKCNSSKVSATTTTGTSALVFESPRAVCPTVCVTSPATSADIVFVKFGGSAVTATAESVGVCVLPGQTRYFQLDGSDLYIAADCPTSTATLYVQTGEGEE